MARLIDEKDRDVLVASITLMVLAVSLVLVGSVVLALAVRVFVMLAGL